MKDREEALRYFDRGIETVADRSCHIVFRFNSGDAQLEKVHFGDFSFWHRL